MAFGAFRLKQRIFPQTEQAAQESHRHFPFARICQSKPDAVYVATGRFFVCKNSLLIPDE
jgi:hypothetical protein